MIDEKIVKQFANYFSGHDSHINKYLPPDKTSSPGEKVGGQVWGEACQLTTELYAGHLDGTQGIGICPVTGEGKLRFALIDVDTYPANFMLYQDIINRYELPFIIFKSKSNGAHLYVFFKGFVSAKKVRSLLKVWRSILGLPAASEIFPKQDILINNGNKVNLPYFGDSRKALNSDLTELNLTDALLLIEQKLQSVAQWEAALNSLPLSDAPICLQSIFIYNNPYPRELYLFNLAIYLKNKFPDTWQGYVEKANEKLPNPLDYKELQGQVIQSNERCIYSYKCGESPLCDRCDKQICYERKYGKNSEEISNLTFEKLKQYLTDPPHYEWVINGAVMTFYTEKELVNQDDFHFQCIRFLHLLPNKLTRNKWMLILNKALSEMDVIQIDINDRLDPGAILASHFYEYVLQGVRALNKEQFAAMNRVFLDEEKGFYYFKREKLFEFITLKKNFKYYAPVELGEKLKALGAEANKKLWINKSTQDVRAWRISVKNVGLLGDRISSPGEVLDFSEFKNEEKF